MNQTFLVSLHSNTQAAIHACRMGNLLKLCTCPNADNDLLIAAVSTNRMPLACVRDILSNLVRSTNVKSTASTGSGEWELEREGLR